MKKKHTSFSNIRREYGSLHLEAIPSDPLVLFHQWFEEIARVEKNDPTAMVVSTVDKSGHPDSRVLLLKGIEESNFLFFTNYESTKALQLSNKPFAALNFYWPVMSRQVRVRGPVRHLSFSQSNEYFSTRPKMSQIGAIASAQSRPMLSREELEIKVAQLVKEYQDKSIPCPKNWGGYAVEALEIEFWQGRDNRLHDRVHYIKKGNNWQFQYLYP